MPIYEYHCKKCGREFEVVQRVTEPDLRQCKYCKGPVKRLMSLTTFHLKGSGWYVTDYGGKKAPAGERDKSEAPAESAAPAEPAAAEAPAKADDAS